MGIVDGVKGALSGVAGGVTGGVVGDVIGAAERALDGVGGGKLAMAMAKFYPGGLAAFLDRLREAGHEAAVDSWLGAVERMPVPAEAVAACLPEAVVERLAYDLSLRPDRVPTALAEFLPAAVAEQSEGGRLKPQPNFSTQVR